MGHCESRFCACCTAAVCGQVSAEFPEFTDELFVYSIGGCLICRDFWRESFRHTYKGPPRGPMMDFAGLRNDTTGLLAEVARTSLALGVPDLAVPTEQMLFEDFYNRDPVCQRCRQGVTSFTIYGLDCLSVLPRLLVCVQCHSDLWTFFARVDSVARYTHGPPTAIPVEPSLVSDSTHPSAGEGGEDTTLADVILDMRSVDPAPRGPDDLSWLL